MLYSLWGLPAHLKLAAAEQQLELKAVQEVYYLQAMELEQGQVVLAELRNS